MSKAHALLRAGFPYIKSIGMRRVTSGPVDVAISKDGTLNVLCRTELGTYIRKCSWEDDDLGTIGGAGTADGSFVWPASLIMDRDENMYVSDEALNRITILGSDGKFLDKWGEKGSGEGQLNRPSGMAFDAQRENIYLADTLNHRIQKFTRGGEFLGSFGSFGHGEGEFDMPWGIATDEDGDVYVTDWRNDRIQKFTGEGEFVFQIGTSGNENGQFNRPSGVTVDADGDIYVVDQGNNRVQLFSREGRYVEKFMGDSGLSRMGRDYLRANAMVLRLREMTNLEAQKLFRGPVSVKVDDQYRMYVTDYGCHRVQVYQKQADRLDPEDIQPPRKSPSLQIA